MGSGASKCSNDKLIDTINETKAQLVIVSESNMDVKNEEMVDARAKNFPGFHFISKTLPGSSNGRLSIYISKEIEYKRLEDLENDVNSTAILEIRRKGKKWSTVIGTYHQWKGTSSSCNHNLRSRHDCLWRFRELLKLYKRVLNLNHN